MTNTTIEILLNKYTDNDHTSSSSESNKSQKQKMREEAQRIEQTLENYDEIDNESPDTEAESGVATQDMSGSEEEDVQYGNPAVNRIDLPRVDFDYKNKTHVEKVLEAAKNLIF